MKLRQLNQLINERDYPCVSIILPCEKDSHKNTCSLKNAILDVEHLLEKFSIPQPSRKEVYQKLEKYLREPCTKWGLGVGIYVSPAKSELVTFPFEVGKKVTVDQHFESIELEHLRQYEPVT